MRTLSFFNLFLTPKQLKYTISKSLVRFHPIRHRQIHIKGKLFYLLTIYVNLTLWRHPLFCWKHLYQLSDSLCYIFIFLILTCIFFSIFFVIYFLIRLWFFISRLILIILIRFLIIWHTTWFIVSFSNDLISLRFFFLFRTLLVGFDVMILYFEILILKFLKHSVCNIDKFRILRVHQSNYNATIKYEYEFDDISLKQK